MTVDDNEIDVREITAISKITRDDLHHTTVLVKFTIYLKGGMKIPVWRNRINITTIDAYTKAIDELAVELTAIRAPLVDAFNANLVETIPQ